MQELWKPKDIAKCLGYSQNHVYILIREGKIPHLRAGEKGEIRITTAGLIEAFGESAEGLLREFKR